MSEGSRIALWGVVAILIGAIALPLTLPWGVGLISIGTITTAIGLAWPHPWEWSA